MAHGVAADAQSLLCRTLPHAESALLHYTKAAERSTGRRPKAKSRGASAAAQHPICSSRDCCGAPTAALYSLPGAYGSLQGAGAPTAARGSHWSTPPAGRLWLPPAVRGALEAAADGKRGRSEQPQRTHSGISARWKRISADLVAGLSPPHLHSRNHCKGVMYTLQDGEVL